VKLTAPQRQFLRELNRGPVQIGEGIYADGRWTGTGRALVSRGLAREKQPRHFVITDAGKQDCAEWAARGFVD
jgi:hypothetical protein